MNKKKLLRSLQKKLGVDNVLYNDVDLQLYEYDAGVDKARPDLVAFPTTTEDVVAIVKVANKYDTPFVARGAGTNLSGGALALKGGIVIEMSRMDEIIEIDIKNLRAVVQPGVINLELQEALAPHGYLYAPDPASQKVSTLGGNIGENSGGPHCLKYGVTTNHVLGLEVVMPDGEVVNLGGKALDTPGYDLTGLFVGSEGTFGIVTKIIVRIMRVPEAVKTMLAVFDKVEDAGDTVSAIIADGIIPATLEMMDKPIIYAIEESYNAGFPLDAEAILIIELDGVNDGMDRLTERVMELCREHNVREFKVAQSEEERDNLWAGRRGAFGAIARLAPNYLVLDGTVPRTELPRMLRRVLDIGEKYGLLVGNVFHAGDGNLHPLLLFDERKEGEKEAAIKAGAEILEACAETGGTISGEHGIGIEKMKAMPLIFSRDDMTAMKMAKAAFDPNNICNPGKIFPEEQIESEKVRK